MNRILVLAAIVLCSSYASASLYLEPYVGYEISTLKGTDVANGLSGSLDYKNNGADFGGKIGYSTLGFAVGADYMAGSLTSKDQNSPPQDTTVKGSDIGAFVQFTFPVLLKVSATYFFSSKGTNSSNADLKGNGFKIGAGFTMFPLISINLDMISVHYNDGTSPLATVTSMDADRKGYMLSVSLPLNLL